MTLSNILLIQFLTLDLLEASIAGVTYMDDFDFEERYTNINECNPYYWHPLHMPQKCLQIFEKLLRKGVKYPLPYRVVRERQADSFDYVNSLEDIDEPYYSMSPFEKLFDLLRRDIRDHPGTPNLGVSPYFGVMSFYKQPVSYKSVNMIEKLARTYAKSSFWSQPLLEYDAYKKRKKKKKVSKKNDTSVWKSKEIKDIYDLLDIK